MNHPDFSLSLALVIGINHYQNGIPALQTARGDAEAISEILERDYQYQVHLLTDSEASSDHIRKWLESDLPDILKTVESSRFLLYFAGHGIALNGDDGIEGYLIPQNARLGDTTTYLPMSQVHQALSQLPCRHFLGILDCCFAGAFRWSCGRDIVPIDLGTIHRERFDRFIRDPAWQVITSAAYDQTALDSFQLQDDRGEKGTHSPFATALIEALKGSADAYPIAEPSKPAGDGVITATELYLYLRDHVELKSGSYSLRQTPGIHPLKKHDKGEYIFLLPGHQLNLPPAPPLDTSSNPYQGLEAFDERHQHLFFGRKALTQQLTEFVVTHSLTVVLGSSGSGKSSLVKAGLIPALRQRKDWHFLPSFRPGESPFRALHHVLESLNLFEVDEFEVNEFEVDEFEVDEKASTHSTIPEKLSRQQTDLKRLADWFKEYPQTHLFVLIDQLEELITLCQDKCEIQQFLSMLSAAIAQYPSQLHVVLTLRSDFEAQFRNTTLEKDWPASRFIVPAMTRKDLQQAIEEPASARVMCFSPHTLVDQLIDEVVDMPGALSLLSFAMSELYLSYLKRQEGARERGERIDRAITHADYEELGGVTRSLTQRAEQEYKALIQETPHHERTIRNVMLRMVSVDGELARRRVPLSELDYSDAENSFVHTVLERFEKARLLISGTDINGRPYQEPAHDALVRGWKRLLTWRQQYLRTLLLQRELTSDANRWKISQQGKQNVGLLWIEDPRLPAVLQLLCGKAYRDTWLNLFKWRLRYKVWQSKSCDYWFNRSESDFIWQSFNQRCQRLVRTAITLTAVICALSGITFYALQRATVAQLREQSTRALNWISTPNAVEGLLLAIDTMDRSRSIDALEMTAQSSLLSATQIVAEFSRRTEHKDTVSSVAFSPDGKRIVSSSEDNTLRLWNAQTGQPIGQPLEGHRKAVWSVAFSPDGVHLVSGSADGTLRLWNAYTGQPLSYPLKGHEGDVRSVAFSPDGKRIVSSGIDKTLRLWNVQTGQPIGQPLSGHSEEIWSVAFSPDGAHLASGSADDTIRLWNAHTGQPVGQPLKGHEDDVSAVAFSFDGKQIVSGSGDKTIRLWDVQTGQPLGEPLRGHSVVVSAVAFSPNGKYIVSGSWDKTIQLWDVQTGQPLGQPLQGHGGPVGTVAFHPNANPIIASGSRDKTLRLWNLETMQLIENPWKGRDIAVSALAFSADGQRIISHGSNNTTLQLWDTETGDPIGEPLKGHTDVVSAVAFSTDNKRLVSGSGDNTLRLWDTETGQPIGQPLQGHGDTINAVAFSPDSKQIVSSSGDNTLRLWDVQTGEPIGQPLQGHGDTINAVAFSPDNKQIATGSDDSTLRLWDAQTGKSIEEPLQGHSAPVRSVTFSADGQYIVSGSHDRTLRVWNTYTGQPIGQSLNDGSPVNAVALSPDNKRIVSASDNGTLRLWDMRTKQPIGQPIHEHGSAVKLVAFSPDGQRIISSSENKTVQSWEASPQSWLTTSCHRLQYHPLLSQPETITTNQDLIKLARRARKVCQQ